jgi:hypothetical protein
MAMSANCPISAREAPSASRSQATAWRNRCGPNGSIPARWQARSTIPETLVFSASLVNGARTVMNR